VETQVPKPHRLKAIVLNGNGHAFDTKTGRSFSINATAQVAVLMLQDGKTQTEVVEALSDLCNQPTAVVDSGINHLFEQMARYVS